MRPRQPVGVSGEEMSAVVLVLVCGAPDPEALHPF